MPSAKGSRKYSIAEARDHLTRIVHEAQDGAFVELTRRGEPVAVLMSAQNYQQFRTVKPQFWNRLMEFRKRVQPGKLKIRPQDWDGLRDRDPGRKVEL
jgi:prevent-host-death family protein